MSTEASGILALWNDCQQQHRPLYEKWYQSEHLLERLGITGFKRGRRYESLGTGAQFFSYYETASPAVLASPAYLQRVNNPTPLTARIMSGIFTNMSRTVCSRLYQHGRYRGSHALCVKLAGAPDDAQWLQLRAQTEADVSIARTELWRAADLPERAATTEEKMRGGDQTIAACLLIETLRDTDLAPLAATLSAVLGNDITEIGSYRLLCELVAEP